MYTNRSPLTSATVLRELRQQVEKALPEAFPAANIDTRSGKAVKVSGGSLPRAVDVVPSHWYDTTQYQANAQEANRKVVIYDKKNHTMIENLPFLHIERVGSRCDSVKGGLRKAIRLCKTLKADSKLNISLSSYDIAAIMYHANMENLSAGQYSELTILTEAHRHLNELCASEHAANQLWVPNGTRKVFDLPEKFAGLKALGNKSALKVGSKIEGSKIRKIFHVHVF